MGGSCECVCNGDGSKRAMYGANPKDDLSAVRSSLIGEEVMFCRVGKDSKDVTEPHQYHQSYIDKHKIKLSYSDKFYREAFRPMHLMHFTYFNKLLDDFLQWYGVQRGQQKGQDLELVAFEKFQQYFQDSHKKLIDKNGPMMRVLKFRGMFVQKFSSIKDDDRMLPSDPFFSGPGSENKQCLDLFTLRILSLVICRGHPEDKAIFLSRVISKNNHDGTSKYMVKQGVCSGNERFKRAIRLITRISTTLPIMFLRAHHHHDVFKTILKNSEDYDDKIWTSSIEYKAETNFDQAFEEFFQQKVVAAIFPENIEYVSHDEFILKFNKKSPSIFSKKREASVEWLFSPVGIYFNYRPYVDLVSRQKVDLISETDFISSFIVDGQTQIQCQRASKQQSEFNW